MKDTSEKLVLDASVGPSNTWYRRPGRSSVGSTKSSATESAKTGGEVAHMVGANPIQGRTRGSLIDLSHAIEDGIVTYRGLPAPVICDFLSRQESRSHYADGTEFHIGRIDMVANTGTYLDTPFHRFADGFDLSELRLESVANVDGVVLSFVERDQRGITARMIQRALGGAIIRDRAVLVATGWDTHWATDKYFEGHPFLTADAAKYLVELGPRLVGIDSLNIDDIGDLSRPVHTQLLRAGIPIVEHLCRLTELPADGFCFSAVPVKVRGMGTFPVRAFAEMR